MATSKTTRSGEAKWIREKLLAGVVLDVPITVDAVIPEDEHKTLRQRFSVVHENECWRCHKKMNPLGMPFEAYNHVGRWRALELDKPVDTSGGITFTGDNSLDGKVQGVRPMMEKLAKSEPRSPEFHSSRLPLLDGTQRNTQRLKDIDCDGQSLRRKRRQLQRTPSQSAHLRLILVQEVAEYEYDQPSSCTQKAFRSGSGAVALSPFIKRISAAEGAQTPKRFVFVVKSSGLQGDYLNPEGLKHRGDVLVDESLEGRKLSDSMKSLEPFKDKLTIIQGLSGQNDQLGP